jgi:hypothetical protein
MVGGQMGADFFEPGAGKLDVITAAPGETSAKKLLTNFLSFSASPVKYKA